MPSRAEPYLCERLWVHPANTGEVVGTTHFEDGRPVRTEYVDGMPESYEYDASGRLTVIHESEDLWHVFEGARQWTGGPVHVEYDDAGAVRLRTQREGIIWERLDEPFEAFFARGVAAYEEAIAATVAEHAEPGTEAFALVVVYVDQGSLHANIELGVRRSGDPLAMLYPESLGYPDVEDDDELDWRLLSRTAMHQPGDPYRYVHAEVCRRLAAREWGGVIVPADDFVVFCAEHDEDTDPKIEMIRAVNPPERVAAWEPIFGALDDHQRAEWLGD